MKLVENWKRAHRMISVQLSVINGAVLAAWQALPADWRAVLPQSLLVKVAIALLVLSIIARLIDQGSTTEPKP